MNTPSSPPGAGRADGDSVRFGALVPLTRPGWVEAGRHLLAGLELAVSEVNAGGGTGGRPLELVVRDTAADPFGSFTPAEPVRDERVRQPNWARTYSRHCSVNSAGVVPSTSFIASSTAPARSGWAPTAR